LGIKRSFALILVTCALFAFLPVPGNAADNGKDPSIYFRPGVRFGSDDRTITTFDFLVPFWQGEKNILFFNPRYSFDNRDGSEVNFGFGYRHLLFADHAVLGINGYYDCRWTGWGTRHEQLGLGAEVMTGSFTGRFNGYFPVTDTQIGPPSGISGYYFRDVGIYTGTGSIEETLGGFDGELGVKVPYLSKYLETWVYAGGYHFEGDYVRDVNGFSTRLEVIPTDFLRLGFEYRNDTLAGNQYFGEAAVTVPFSIDNLVKGKNPFAGIGKHFGGERTLHERLVEPVRRDVDVRLHNAGGGPGLPGTESLVEDVIFVSEGAADGAGDGTFEDPFASIAEAVTAMSSGGIYSGVTTVHVMDDTGSDTVGGGTADIANLLIWGSGAAHPTYGYITNQYLTSPDISALEITAGGVEVFGSNFVGTTGITTGGSGTYVHDNYFTATTGLNVTGGSATITNNIFSDTYGVYTDGGVSTITGNTFGGTYGVYTVGGSSIVTDNTFSSGYGVYTTGGTSTVTGNTFSGTYGAYGMGGSSTVTDNDFLGNTFGIYADGGDFTITGNTIGTAANPVTYTGIYLGQALGVYSVTGNTMAVSNTGSNAYGIVSYVANLVLGSNDISVTSGLTAYGIYGHSDTDDLTGSITGGSITATGNSAYGAYLEAAGGSIGSSTSPFTVSGATIDAAGTGDTYGLYLSTGGDLYGSVIDSNITGTSESGTGYGIYKYASSTLNGSITGGTITAGGTSAYGIYLRTYYGSIGSAASPFTISGVTVDATGTGGNAYGIWQYTQEGSLFGSITGGSITASGTRGVGISLEAPGAIGDSGSPFTVSGSTITATSTTDFAAGFMAYTDGGDIWALLTGNTITATSSDYIANGVYEFASGSLGGRIYGGSVTASGLVAEGAYLCGAHAIGSLARPYTISGATFDVTATSDTYTYGVRYLTDGYLYTSILDSSITSRDTLGTAFGVYGYGYDGFYGTIDNSTITATGLEAYGVQLRSNGSIGSVSNPFAITETTITATGSGGNAYGLYEYANNGDIFSFIIGGSITASGTRGVGISLEAPGAIGDSSTPFTVSGNTITAISTTDYAVGFLASADGGDIWALLTDNIITATSSDYSAYGISEFASGNLGGGIYGGSVTASGLVAEGAYLCGGDTIGSSTDPYTISGVTFDVTATFPTYTYGVRYLTDGYLNTLIGISSITVNNAMGVAFGVYGYGYDGLYGAIGNSTITATGLEAHGVQLRSNGSIGSASNPFTISGTTITATGSGGNACGLYEYANNGDIFGSITGGTITGTSTGGNAWGIYLEADAGSIGGSTSPFTITGVTINATGTERAYGVYEHAYDAVYGRISDGVDITASGLGAYGIYLLADTGSIGSSGSPFTISGVGINSTATGVNYSAYGVYMESAGGDIYAVIEYPYITATVGDGFAYGVYEDAAGDIYGEIHSGTIIARGEYSMYGVRLSAGGSIGSSGNYFTISDATIEARDLGSASYAYGVQLGAGGNLYSLIEDSYITVGGSSGGVNAYGIFEGAQGTIYGGIFDGRITATGSYAAGVRLYPYSLLGDSANPFTISDVTITATASDSGALGVYLSSMSSGDLYADIIDSTITATSESYNAFGVYGLTSGNLHTTITDSYITATSENSNAYGLYEWAGGSISGGIWGGSITVNGDDSASGVFLESLGSIGSSGDPFTISAVTINATGEGDTYGLSFESGDDLYSFIDGDAITATSVGGFAYGVYEHAYDNLRGEFYSGRITASGLGAYGIYLLSDTGSIGSSSDLFEISRTRVTSTATGYYDVYGIYMESAGGNIYAAIKNGNITATEGDIYGYGIFETAQGSIYGEISGGTITATGVDAIGVRLDTYGSLGDSTHPFTISGATITATGTTAGSFLFATGVLISSNSDADLYAAITGNTITATSGGSNAHGIFEMTNGNLYTTITNNTITATSGGSHARGIYEWAGGSIFGGIFGGSITVNGDDSARAINLFSSGSIGSSTSPFTVSGVTANVTSGVARYFMYLDGSGSGTSAITWTGNSYTPYGGLWSGNYDTTGFVTNGPLFLNGITDAEVTP
jgi:hypothetical protein